MLDFANVTRHGVKMTIRSGHIPDMLRNAAMRLTDVSDTPRLDAELLMAHATGMSRGDMLMRQRDLQPPENFEKLLVRRLQNEPVAYIVGTQEFWDLTLVTTPDVLIPRADSETLIEAAKSAFTGNLGPKNILDLGTGSGALILAALSLFPGATGTAIDASEPALNIARINAEKTGFADHVQMLHASWRDEGWDDALPGPFDLILCNPPYVESHADLAPMVVDYEPKSALFAGPDGLDDYRLLFPALPRIMSRSGISIFEIGHEQGAATVELAKKYGLNAQIKNDLAGKSRALLLRYSAK